MRLGWRLIAQVPSLIRGTVQLSGSALGSSAAARRMPVWEFSDRASGSCNYEPT